jgi:hypothetical protein
MLITQTAPGQYVVSSTSGPVPGKGDASDVCGWSNLANFPATYGAGVLTFTFRPDDSCPNKTVTVTMTVNSSCTQASATFTAVGCSSCTSDVNHANCSGCGSLTCTPPTSSTALRTGGATPVDGGAGGLRDAGVAIAVADKVDLLFMIDNSPSMADKQAILKDAIPQLVKRLVNPGCIRADGTYDSDYNGNACPAGTTRDFDPVNDIHIGIITSSIGAHGASVCLATETGHNNWDRRRPDNDLPIDGRRRPRDRLRLRGAA